VPEGFNCEIENAQGFDGTTRFAYMLTQNYEYSDAVNSLGFLDLSNSGSYTALNQGGDFIAISVASGTSDATTQGEDWSSNMWEF
jgi:hypothetical protein